MRRGWIDLATKKFIVWANAQFVPLAAQMKIVEDYLKNFEAASGVKEQLPQGMQNRQSILLTGSRMHRAQQIKNVANQDLRIAPLLNLRDRIQTFLQRVDEKEQPSSRIYDLIQDARRHQRIQIHMAWTPEDLQTRNLLLAMVLLFRCDYALATSFLSMCKGRVPKMTVDLALHRQDCEALVAECQDRNQLSNEVEGHLYWARFTGLERGFDTVSYRSQSILEAQYHLDEAEALLPEVSWANAWYAG